MSDLRKDFPKGFAGTEHYREKAAFLREHEPMVYHRPYRIDLEALCDHIEDLEKQKKQAWDRAALEARRVLQNGSKARRLEQENAELRDMLRNNNEVYREETGRLRERVEELEGTLRKCLTYLTTAIDVMRRRHPELIPEDGLVEEALEEEVRAALSQAGLEAENQEEEAKP